MKFLETPLKGAYVIEPERIEDDRGFFARSWCVKEFEERGLNTSVVQCNISFNEKKGTLRGMHWQARPYAEVKLLRVTSGAICDVIVDIRPGSPTYRKWFSVELSAANRAMLYIPEDFAHGFITLEDDTEISYQMSEFYHPESARGFRWNDPGIGIKWPAVGEITISERDASLHVLDNSL